MGKIDSQIQSVQKDKEKVGALSVGVDVSLVHGELDNLKNGLEGLLKSIEEYQKTFIYKVRNFFTWGGLEKRLEGIKADIEKQKDTFESRKNEMGNSSENILEQLRGHKDTYEERREEAQKAKEQFADKKDKLLKESEEEVDKIRAELVERVSHSFKKA